MKDGKLKEVKELSDWLAYYQTIMEDLRHSKRQHWNLCYYTLLIFAAVIGLTRLPNTNLKDYVCLIKWVTGVITLFVTWFLIKFQFVDMNRYREKKNQVIKEKFPNELEKIVLHKSASNWWYSYDFLIFSIPVIWLGYLAVWFVIRS